MISIKLYSLHEVGRDSVNPPADTNQKVLQVADRRSLLLDFDHSFVYDSELILNLLQHPAKHQLSFFQVRLCLFFPGIILVLFVDQLADLRLKSEEFNCLLFQN